MSAFDHSTFECYRDEAREKWGSTDAYKEHEERTRDYSGETWADLAAGMDRIIAEFAACRKQGNPPDSPEAQALVAMLQNHITQHYYRCTDGILAGLGQMYVADERFRNNIDRHGDGTAAFLCEAITFHCGT